MSSAAAAVALPRPAQANNDDTIGGAFALVDQDGKAVTDRTYRGKPALLYFGFMSCPDICPTDLARMARIARSVRALGGPELTPIFVSVDPDRDTPDRLKAYVGSFGKTFVGLTGTPRQVEAVTARYHVYYRKVPVGTEGAYTIDHSTFLFLLDRNGSYREHFGRNVDEQQVARQVVAALADRHARVAGRRQPIARRAATVPPQRD